MRLLAATSSDPLTVSVPLLVASAGVAVVWLIELAVVMAIRRIPKIHSTPAGMDLPPESPAVAGMLAADFVVPDETAPAVLLDLAARHIVDLDEVQPGRTICRVRAGTDDSLSAAEARVLDAIRDKAVGGVVPTDALTTGTEDMSKGWHRALARAVVIESQSNDLTIDRWPKSLVAVLGTGLGLVLVLLALAVSSHDVLADNDEVLAAITGAISVAVIALGVLVVTHLGRSLAQLPTDAGREAAARVAGLERQLQEDTALADLPPAAVKVRGRYLAYAAIFGAAPLAVALLPMGAEDDRRAWSSFGGRWHRVRVRYPRVMPPAWGRSPGSATLLALAVGAAAVLGTRGLVSLAGSDRPVGLGVDAWNWFELGVVVAIVPLAAAFLWSVWVLLRALPDIGGHRSVHGAVVRSRRFQRRVGADDTRYLLFLAIDDGTSDRIRAFRVREAMWHEVSQGDVVDADVTPLLGYVRSVQPAAPSKPG
jgi:Predicted membrane protein (DUF2207)